MIRMKLNLQMRIMIYVYAHFTEQFSINGNPTLVIKGLPLFIMFFYCHINLVSLLQGIVQQPASDVKVGTADGE